MSRTKKPAALEQPGPALSSINQALDLANLSLENIDSMLGVCSEALRGGASAGAVAATLDWGVHREIASAQTYVRKALNAAKGVRHE